MNRSDTIAELTKALSKVQATIEGAKKDSVNPFHHSKYADLSTGSHYGRDGTIVSIAQPRQVRAGARPANHNKPRWEAPDD